MNAYLHIPFCSSFCSYCDFTSFEGREDLLSSYVETLIAEIGASDLVGPLRTVYFGGGTPSLLDPGALGRIMEVLRSKAGIAEGAEISMEANPDTVDSSRLQGYRREGVTRLSLGAQTSHRDLLALLSRCHDWGQVERAVHGAREAGFGDVNLDLMIGLPGQTVPRVRETLGSALSLEPDHLSVYALQLEPRTPLEAKVKSGLSLPGDDETADQYEEVQRVLEAAGYGQYEVSNWCRPGRECRHNLAIWQGEDYWGFGVSAVGTQGLVRKTNTSELDRYLDLPSRGLSATAEQEEIPPQVRDFERLMLMLRTRWGAPEALVEGCRKGVSASAQDRFQAILDQGWLVLEKGRYHPAPSGYLRLNSVLETLLV